jgi:putative DNA primase/helicase
MADTGLDPFRPLDAVERARASIDRGLRNEDFVPVVPVPDDASEPDWNWQGSRKPAAVWRYHDERGGLLSYVARFDRPDGGKDICPFHILARPFRGIGMASEASSWSKSSLWC